MRAIRIFCWLSLFLVLDLSRIAQGQITEHGKVPHRFGVIDVQTQQGGGQDFGGREPGIALGTGANYGKLVLHFVTDGEPLGTYSACTNSGPPPWFDETPTDNSSYDVNLDGTLDWSSGGTCYEARLPVKTTLQVRASSDPTAGVPFSTIAGAAVTVAGIADQPWLKVVNVQNVDHIFVGFNDTSKYPGASATVRYSLNGGVNWSSTIIDKAPPAMGDLLVRLAISPDGSTVYGLFQRISASFGFDLKGDVVLVRDDNQGGSGFGALGNGTVVASSIVIPYGTTSLGAQRLGGGFDVAVSPADPKKVYVAYTQVIGSETLNNTPYLQVNFSANRGATFTNLYTIAGASLPSLAVAADGTVGLLYALMNYNTGDLEIHFLKAFSGDFAHSRSERVLAKFPNNNPVKTFDPYIGDYFALKAVNDSFFGSFCASNDPQPSHFPSGVYFQLPVSVGGMVQSNFWLTAPGTCVDRSGNSVPIHIDTFAFYDIAPAFFRNPLVTLIAPGAFVDPNDPMKGLEHLSWPLLPSDEPQFQLFSSPTLGPTAGWTPATNIPTVQTNGQFYAAFIGPQHAQFFRLVQTNQGAQFQLFVAAGDQGSLNPTGEMLVPGGATLNFTATPSNNYAISQWYLDGELVQNGGSTFALTNILTEHTLLATFVASNDLAVTIADLPVMAGPTVTSGTNVFQISVQNRGLTTLSAITLTNPLPASVQFISAASSQGTVTNSTNVVTANLGSLAEGTSANLNITVVTLAAGTITDTVTVACAQFEPNLANNTASDVTTVINAVVITNQPASQTVPAGSNVTFRVGVSGTPPFQYQWRFDGSIIASATNSSLTLTNVSSAQAGSYSVIAFQTIGLPEDDLEAYSQTATLALSPSGTSSSPTLAPTSIAPRPRRGHFSFAPRP